MLLPWRPVAIGEGSPIATSLTAGESGRLAELARGRRVLELGSAYGYSAVILGRVADSVLAVDPHEGYGSLPESLGLMRKAVVAHGVSDRVAIMLARSQDALRALAGVGARFDLVFIDGDHRVDAVREDVRAAWELLTAAGVLACHDYGEQSCPGVAEALDAWRDPDELVDTLWLARRSEGAC